MASGLTNTNNMKKEILKIAGVKSEKEFYKKFPDEASFMKAHGKEFKKAMRASNLEKSQAGSSIPNPGSMLNFLNTFGGGVNIPIPGVNAPIDESTIDRPPSDLADLRRMEARAQANRDAAILGRSTGGQNFDVTNPTGQDLLKMRSSDEKKSKTKNTYKDPYVQGASDILGGAMSLKQQKQDVAGAKQKSKLSGVQAQAAGLRPMEPIQRQYIRPEDVVYQPEQMFPSYGVGTNVLAEDGAVINQIGGNPTEIMNTFAPNTIYSDMGYEPLSDSNKVKQYYHGGVHKAQDGFDFSSFMTGGGGDVLGMGAQALTSKGGYEEAGSKIGGGIGRIAGTAIAGPVGGMIGDVAGKLIGGAIDTSSENIARYNEESDENIAEIMGSQAGLRFQNQFSSKLRKGGYVVKAQKGTKEEKDLTKKDGKCAAEEARNKEYSALDKISAAADRAGEIAARQEAKQIASQQRADYADYINERLTPYGEKMKQKDFDAAYQTFAAQNPELAKDRLLYTVASKELPKLRSKDYYLRGKLSKIDPQLGYDTLTLPALMQTMQRGYGGSKGYLEAWNRGFPQQENGGQTSEYEWISHTWQPQVITHFGEHKVSDLLRPPADADMLRAGGEIRNLRKNYMSPEEEMLTNMAFGGQLETTWGGHAEPISQNPYLPGTGQTVMFRGQSHDESDGKGRTGIGVKYGKPDSYTEYAEYGTTSDADVEVERNEPAVELPNGDGDNSMVVYGNLKIPNQFLSEIGDPKAKGKKFKTYVADLSKKEKRQNKIIDKASEKLDDLNPVSPFDRLKFNSLAANIEGANMKLKEYAEFKTNAAAVQNAINDTAEEMGLDADKLAKGKVAMAKRGAEVPKAQRGILAGRRGRAELASVNPAIKGLLDLFAKKNYDASATSGYRAGATTSQGKPSRHSKGEAMDVVFPTLGAGAYDAILNDPEIVEYMLQNDITAINEYDPETQKATGATGPHIHFGFDRGTSLSDKFRKEAAAKYPSALTPITKTGLPKVSPDDFKYLQDLYGTAQKEKRGPAVLKFQQEFHRLAPDYAKDVLSKYPVTTFGQKKGYKVTDLDQNLDSIFGKRTEQYMAALNSGMGDIPSGDMANVKELGELILSPSKKTEKKETSKFQITPYKRNVLMDALGAMLPYLRPSDVEELDPSQLMGEMYALSTNQVEPVWAQKLTPRLSVPMDISLQDILNENRAVLRRQQQTLGYNPAAQSAFAAQEYGANQRVLGEQFRLNQAEKQRVYEQNRNILNQYDLANMGILDKQYERQATALSKTKATTQEALNSIASKIGQNKLENRTLATYENLYNYRFDPRFRAQSMQLAQWNIPNQYGSLSVTKETPVYGPDGKTILYYKTSESDVPSLATPPINAKKGSSVKKRKDAMNSTVVRALKNV